MVSLISTKDISFSLSLRCCYSEKKERAGKRRKNARRRREKRRDTRSARAGIGVLNGSENKKRGKLHKRHDVRDVFFVLLFAQKLSKKPSAKFGKEGQQWWLCWRKKEKRARCHRGPIVGIFGEKKRRRRCFQVHILGAKSREFSNAARTRGRERFGGRIGGGHRMHGRL